MKKLSSFLPLPATMCMLTVTIMLAIITISCSEVVHAAQGEAVVHLDATHHGMGPPSPRGGPLIRSSPTPKARPCINYPKCRR
ncbi:hypothetical protein BS78_K088000 [Paspalum vaginatum]|uniref:Transmembrane protein n=1 Tax=Paspalum vaginatum TaxID=158149 RepID=A0A9W8CFU5_9POAL|nr:hypothetical protein BS78_K088000 [Paspalum vaginatum]